MRKAISRKSNSFLLYNYELRIVNKENRTKHSEIFYYKLFFVF